LRSKIEERLVVRSDPPRRKEIVGEFLGLSSAEGPVRDRAREDATDVRVEHGDSGPKGEGRHRVRRVLANPRQRKQ
jgi:hypothetical protein